jgi:hypothetical protein
VVKSLGGPCESRGKGGARRKAREEGPRGAKSEAREERGAKPGNREERRRRSEARKESRGKGGARRNAREERGAKREKGSNEERFGFLKYKVLRPRPLQNNGLAAFSFGKCGQTVVLEACV